MLSKQTELQTQSVYSLQEVNRDIDHSAATELNPVLKNTAISGCWLAIKIHKTAQIYNILTNVKGTAGGLQRKYIKHTLFKSL